MKPLGTHNYFVYITTNITRKVLYTGVSNDLKRRLYEHEQAALNGESHFTSKYKVFYLIYWERFSYIYQAIEREKQIKGWRRSKKVALITAFNPEWKFLNEDLE